MSSCHGLRNIEVAQINEYEMIHLQSSKWRKILNMIKAEAGSGVVTLNGAAAFKGSKNIKSSYVRTLI